MKPSKAVQKQINNIWDVFISKKLSLWRDDFCFIKDLQEQYSRSLNEKEKERYTQFIFSAEKVMEDFSSFLGSKSF